MKVLQDDLNTTNTNIKNLQRSGYFVDQEIKRKKALVKSYSADLERTTKQKLMMSKLQSRINSEVLFYLI